MDRLKSPTFVLLGPMNPHKNILRFQRDANRKPVSDGHLIGNGLIYFIMIDPLCHFTEYQISAKTLHPLYFKS